MAELFASGRLIDLILIIVVAEAACLVVYARVAGRGIAAADVLPNLGAGARLLLALRATLANAGWMLPCACLGLAGGAHLIDLSRRWNR